MSVAATPSRIGEYWGYPDLTLPIGIAQTNLLVYHLSLEHWESVRTIAPELFPLAIAGLYSHLAQLQLYS